jgi:hypothetical protein
VCLRRGARGRQFAVGVALVTETGPESVRHSAIERPVHNGSGTIACVARMAKILNRSPQRVRLAVGMRNKSGCGWKGPYLDGEVPADP